MNRYLAYCPNPLILFLLYFIFGTAKYTFEVQRDGKCIFYKLIMIIFTHMVYIMVAQMISPCSPFYQTHYYDVI